MATVIIEEGKLGARLRSDASKGGTTVRNAMRAAAERGRSYIVGKTPVDRGLLRNAWKVIKTPDGSELINEQPYAGVMELGARPFKISSDGLFYLKGWVMRKLLVGEMQPRTLKAFYPRASIKTKNPSRRKKTPALEREAESIAWAIAKKFEQVGIKGKRFVWFALPKLAEIMDEEIKRYLDKFFSRPME